MSSRILVALAGLCVLVLGCVALLLSRSLLAQTAAFGLAALPILVYFAIVRPIVVPYTLYAFLLPFDNLLSFSTWGTITKFLGILATGAILLWALRTERFTMPGRPWFIGLAFVLWLCASLLWAMRLDLSFNVLPTYVGLFLLYSALSTARIEWRDLALVFGALVAGSIMAAAYGIYLFRDESAVQSSALQSSLGRLELHSGATIIDPNHFSDALVLPFALLLVPALRPGSILVRVAAVAGLLIMLGAIYVSASREAIIAIGVIVAYLIIRSPHRLKLVAVAACGAVACLAGQSVLFQRFASAASSGGSGRVAIWQVGFEAFRRHWLAGAGVGNYREVYDTVFMTVYQAYSGGWSRVAHNLIVQSSAELGIIGLILVLAFWFGHFFMMRHIKRGDPLFDYRLALEAGLIALFVASMFIDLIWYKYLWFLFSSVAQLRIVSLAPASIEHDSMPAGVEGRRSAVFRRALTAR
jgi:O-antigen ligase